MIKVLYHANAPGKPCVDGYTAAAVCFLNFGASAEYIPVVYGEPAPQVFPDDRILIVDFSYPRNVLLDMESKLIRGNLTVLDHHLSAQKELGDLEFATFDMERSGAQLAWDYFNPPSFGQSRHPLVDYVADRDLWRKSLLNTEVVNRAISTFPKDFGTYSYLFSLSPGDFIDLCLAIGTPLQAAYMKEVEELADTFTMGRIGEHVVPSISTEKYHLMSDALDVILRRNPEAEFAFNWVDKGDSLSYNLRSIGSFDVSAFAKERGGGGHRGAAGFTIRKSKS